MDLIAGDTAGNVWLFLNTGTKERPELAQKEHVKVDGKLITSKSNLLAEIYSKVHMADWDGDGLKDLLVGHINTIIMYKNVGTQSAPRFQAPVKIKGNFPNRPSPYVVDWDGDGKKDLLVGCEEPKVYFYRNIGTDKNPLLADGEDLKLRIPEPNAGYRWRIAVTDWNNDGKQDILVGNIYTVREARGRAGGNIWLFLGE